MQAESEEDDELFQKAQHLLLNNLHSKFWSELYFDVAAMYNFTNQSRNQNAMQNKILGYVCICINYIYTIIM